MHFHMYIFFQKKERSA